MKLSFIYIGYGLALPGFTAEKTVYKPEKYYRSNIGSIHLAHMEIIPSLPLGSFGCDEKCIDKCEAICMSEGYPPEKRFACKRLCAHDCCPSLAPVM